MNSEMNKNSWNVAYTKALDCGFSSLLVQWLIVFPMQFMISLKFIRLLRVVFSSQQVIG